jgi:hypothetical protein
MLPLYVGYLIKAGDYKEPGILVAGTSLGIEYVKQGKYISGDEKRGHKLAKVILRLLDMRLKIG